MATFNFTVRATDNVGAYADRTFSLNVNNTIYDRFVIVGTNGLYRSVSGAASAAAWTYEAGMSGTHVQFGGGKWVVFTGTTNGNSPMIRTSADGTNWSTVPITTAAVTGEQFYGIVMAKYRNGAWIGMGLTRNNANGAQWSLVEYSSPDAIAWTRVALVSGGDSSTTNPHDFEVGPNGDVVLSFGTGIRGLRKFGTASYNNSYSWPGGIYNNDPAGSGIAVKNYNGVWIVNAHAYVYTSVDAVNWVQRTVNSSGFLTAGLIYLNGSILSTFYRTDGYGPTTYESITAGRTWQVNSRGATTARFDPRYGSTRGVFASVGGTTISITSGETTYGVTTDDYATSTTFSFGGTIGTIRSCAARDGLN